VYVLLSESPEKLKAVLHQLLLKLECFSLKRKVITGLMIGHDVEKEGGGRREIVKYQ